MVIMTFMAHEESSDAGGEHHCLDFDKNKDKDDMQRSTTTELKLINQHRVINNCEEVETLVTLQLEESERSFCQEAPCQPPGCAANVGIRHFSPFFLSVSCYPRMHCAVKFVLHSG